MLTISLIQSNLSWEDKTTNLRMFEKKIAALPRESHVAILPETFSTGFSMRPQALAETMDGQTAQWMRAIASKYRKIITGSIIIEDSDRYYNRLIWMQPDKMAYYYDKRHLFGYGGEDEHFSPGHKRLIVQVNGWKICPLICYDLRFPVWARQDKDAPYDLLVYVANWPERRNVAWKTLLQARAIENQCYTIGVNRVGNDGNANYHSGDSSLIDPMGNIIWRQADEEASFTYTLRKEELGKVRQQLPFLNDADKFIIH